MTEFARTPSALQRLYRSIDLAPLPQHEAIAQSLDGWRKARGTHVVPGPLQVGKEQPSSVLRSSLIAEQLPTHGDFELRSTGELSRELIGLREGARKLTEMEDARIAARLRQVFRFAIKQGEPVVVSFTNKDRDFEVLAAPLVLDNSQMGIWCTLAATALEPQMTA